MDSLCLVAHCGRPSRGGQATRAMPRPRFLHDCRLLLRGNGLASCEARLGGLPLVMLDIILDSLVPIFFGMGLGYVAGWTRDIDNKQVGVLNALVMDFALPAAIFGAVAQQSRGALARPDSPRRKPQHLDAPALCRDLFHGPAGCSMRALRRHRPRRSRPRRRISGLPGCRSSALCSAPTTWSRWRWLSPSPALVLSPLTLIILERHAGAGHKQGIASSLLSAYRKPIVLTPLVAVLFVLSGIGLPEPLTKSFSLMGQVAGGTALFLTGLILSAQKIRLGKSVAIQTLLANIIHPLLAAGLACSSPCRRSPPARRSCSRPCPPASSESCSGCVSAWRRR